MSYQLGYSILHEYDPGQSGISVAVSLSAAGNKQRVQAKVDPGATYCVFRREVGEALGLNIEAGIEEWIGTQTGSLRTFGHAVTLETLGINFESVVYFAAHPNLPRNVLGRYGWMQRLNLGIVDYEGKLYVGLYDGPADAA